VNSAPPINAILLAITFLAERSTATQLAEMALILAGWVVADDPTCGLSHAR
jgi:uncharacterized membrane protein